jgi:hypothetical protein
MDGFSHLLGRSELSCLHEALCPRVLTPIFPDLIRSETIRFFA